ncbi:MAG TPA: homoserine kinase [Acidimicrobiia bacterium]|nr:homoserine kinase [Acidimicrobiia bacterium]
MKASAPASSANLGPGFDVLGLAFDLRCVVQAQPAEWMTVDDGAGPIDLHPGDMLFDAVTTAVGRPMALTVSNAIPRARGLGSSSAVTAASVAAALRAVGIDPQRDAIYEIVAGIEGHGDNAASTVWGGLMVVGSNGPHRLEINDRLVPVVGIPDTRLSTNSARKVVPSSVPLSAAVRNVSRAVLLVEALRTGDPAAFAEAGGDEFHELQRGRLSPITGRMIDAARAAGALHAAWSGAGPTALALATAATQDAVVEALAAVLGDAGAARILRVDYDGLR